MAIASFEQLFEWRWQVSKSCLSGDHRLFVLGALTKEQCPLMEVTAEKDRIPRVIERHK